VLWARPVFQKVLVANRGEIAVRVLRALRSLGIKSVAVYSDADRDALHVRLADEAVHLGPAAPAESYLQQDRLLEAVESTGAAAVHPGYGFLSENAGFARRLEQAGIAFIGPSPAAMEKLGDKVAARRLAIKEQVPVSPGSEGVVPDMQAAKKIAREIGYPVMLKAAAGGGGIGMRIVRDEKEMEKAFQGAEETARGAFGVGDLFLEKFLERPRHIEVQVLGDKHGHLIHLGERECSIQRRHQKVVEEAPSPVLSAHDRADVGAMAVRLAKAGGYHNAGTMEFLYQDGSFYFNEMNTRLQVEHPVTEMTTGIDLVAWQIKIAAGERLTIKQDEVQSTGHAIELRINAEDPARGFAPSPGRVRRFQPPSGPGVRVDHGLVAGWTVPSTYDSMVAKVIVWGADRQEAIARAEAALGETVLEGFPTNLELHRRILSDPAFREGDLSTRFLEERGILAALTGRATPEQRAALERVAAVVAALATPQGGGLHLLHARQNAVPRVRGVIPKGARGAAAEVRP
jgi:acetyl-CoA carboxylase biotin carboxylase subunit